MGIYKEEPRLINGKTVEEWNRLLEIARGKTETADEYQENENQHPFSEPMSNSVVIAEKLAWLEIGNIPRNMLRKKENERLDSVLERQGIYPRLLSNNDQEKLNQAIAEYRASISRKTVDASSAPLNKAASHATAKHDEIPAKSNEIPKTCGECCFYSTDTVFSHYDDLDGWDVYYTEVKCSANGMKIDSIREEGSFGYDYGEGERTRNSRPPNCPLLNQG